jgi:hypothetical protein
MRGLKAAITIILLLVLGTAVYAQEPATTKEQSGSAQEKATAAKEDDRLPFQREGWQFFLAPYLWIPNIHPLVGMRIGLWFTQKLNLILKADCGGFGFVAYNNVTTVIEGLVGYQVHKNIRIYGGYSGRYLSASGSTKDIALHGWLHGPKLGAEFSF